MRAEAAKMTVICQSALSNAASLGVGRLSGPAQLKAPFTQDAEVLANVLCKEWNQLLPEGVFTQQTSDIKGFGSKFV